MHKKLKRKLYLILALLCCIVGLLLLFLPWASDEVIKKQQNDVNIAEITAERLQANVNSEASFDFDLVRNISATETWGHVNNYNKENIIGQLVIPKHGINLTLFKGLDEANLIAGVGTMKADQSMGKGNYTIAGHRAKSKGVLFHNLMYVEEGDEIRLTDKDKIYIYRAKEVIETDPYAFYMLEDERSQYFDNKAIITLMTCYYGSSDSRFFVTGALEKVIPYSEQDMTKE